MSLKSEPMQEDDNNSDQDTKIIDNINNKKQQTVNINKISKIKRTMSGIVTTEDTLNDQKSNNELIKLPQIWNKYQGKINCEIPWAIFDKYIISLSLKWDGLHVKEQSLVIIYIIL